MFPVAVASVALSVAAVTTRFTSSNQADQQQQRGRGSAFPHSERRSHSRAPSRSAGMFSSGGRYDESRRSELKKIGDETMRAIQNGMYPFKGVDHQLSLRVKEAKKNTAYHAPDSPVAQWATTNANYHSPTPTHISVLHVTTLDAARLLESVYKNNPSDMGKTGVLNFASATKPGGGFKNGAEAQEESIARSSTLYPTLMTDEASKFYKLHTRESAQNAAAYYSHAIIYSPKVTVFRDDDGVWTYPFDVDVLSCAAVNAGEVRKAANGAISAGLEVHIEKEMTERMGRILYVFEQQGVRNLVLGTFGTGVFRNDVVTVARIWAQLLILHDARFKDSFDRIIFAVTGEETFADFQSSFDAWGQRRAPGLGQGRTQAG